jgi:hypothetical protein
MENKFKIIKSEFITHKYNVNNKYIHWSRIYEWSYVIETIKDIKPKTIHNTACGGLDEGDCLHLTFCRDIDELCDSTTHSDTWGGGYIGTDNKPDKNNFIYYDITKPFDGKSDMVLNISTIEHLPKDNIIESIDNLLNQLNKKGHLILTFDYPDIDIKTIEDYFNVEITKPDNSITNGRLSVVLIHLIKL